MLKLRRLKDQISSDQNSLKQKQSTLILAAAFIKNDKKEKGSSFTFLQLHVSHNETRCTVINICYLHTTTG